MPLHERPDQGPGPQRRMGWTGAMGWRGAVLRGAALLGLALLIVTGCGSRAPGLSDMPEYAAGKTYLLQQETLRRHAAAVRAEQERLARQYARQHAAQRDILWEKLRRVLENPAHRLDHDGA